MSIFALVLGCSAADDERTLHPAGERIRYSVQVTNATQRVLPRAQLWLASPSSEAASQQVSAVEVARAHRIVGTAHGNRQIYLEFTDVPVGFDEKIDVDAWIEFDGAPDADTAAADVDPRYLEPAPGVESADAVVLEQARNLARDEAGSTASAILDWVRGFELVSAAPVEEEAIPTEALPPGAPGDELAPRRGARQALETGTGNTADRAMLAVALLRASGVPSRAVLGFSAEEGVSLTSEHLGLWIEYAADGRWHRGLLEPSASESAARVVALKVIDDPAKISPGREFAFLHEAVGLRVELVN